MYSGTISGLGPELHRWLEEVHVQPHIIIKSVQTLIRRSGGIPIVAHQTAHHIAVLLFHMTAIVFLVGTRAGEGNLLPLSVGHTGILVCCRL